MRKNLPITDQEFVLQDDQYLISKTDLKGRITYCNPAFVAISGFTREELLGQPHNIVRHPDMPPAVFEDMWDTLSAGKPWLAVVKNRHKSGGYYWVLANATPVIENGEVTGYASVRVKASAEQIHTAAAFYEAVADGNLGGYALKHGRRVPAGWRRAVRAFGMPFRGGLRPSLLRVAVGAAALGAIPTWLAARAAPAEQLPWYWGGYAVAVLAVLWATQRVAGSFSRQLVNAEEAARQIAAGNLVNEVSTDARGELRNLYFYLDIMRKSLIGISTEVIGKTSDHVRTISKLHTDSQGLADRTEAQAGSLQDTAASVEQLAATVARNAESARSAAALTQESRVVVGQGGQIVSQLVTTMHGIDESSRKISDIVSVIEGIAFQTNILALNAAVEAARAGDQGKGFAVVAGEVRSLAQRTTQAAKEVKTLIEESVGRMSAGSNQASQAGATMQEILQSVERVSVLMEEISTASQEQAQGVDRISSAVNEMDGVVQQNVSLVGELSHVAEHLGEESAALAQAIGVFRTPASRAAPDAVQLRTEARTTRLAHGGGQAQRLALASPRDD